METKKNITKKAWENIFKSLLNKGMDVDRAVDWMEKRFIEVSTEDFQLEQLRVAKERGLIEDAEPVNDAEPVSA